ncbi:hypothetical protein AB4072_01915 [Microvirga sp. 2MCAF38]
MAKEGNNPPPDPVDEDRKRQLNTLISLSDRFGPTHVTRGGSGVS